MKAKGYIKILWYQQRSQGGNFMISEKKRLPKMAANETESWIKRRTLVSCLESRCCIQCIVKTLELDEGQMNPDFFRHVWLNSPFLTRYRIIKPVLLKLSRDEGKIKA